MSIIERSNPLNLQYRVCIVTSASTPLGVIICKTLLKANALVLGVDSLPKDPSLNAGLGTHFQSVQCEFGDEGAVEKVVEATSENFGVERIDVLVNVVYGGREGDLRGLRELSDVVGEVMGREGMGTIVNVVGDVEDKKTNHANAIVQFTRDVMGKSHKAVRCNVVVPEAKGEPDQPSAATYQEAKTHMTALMNSEKFERLRIRKDVPSATESKYTATKFYDAANLTLFLAGDMSEGVTAMAVGLDGSFCPLSSA